MNMNLEVKPFEQIYTVTENISEQSGKLNITADMGSTGTRTVVFELPPAFSISEVLQLDSAFSIVDADISGHRNQSNQLNDLLEIEITDVTQGKPDECKVFPHLTRIVKGGLLKDIGASVESVSSDLGKSEQRATFVNAITNIGIRLLMKQHNTRQRHASYDVDLTVALTNEDTQNTNRLNKFKHKLAGVYLFALPRLGYSVYINIEERSISIEDESLAVLRYWQTYNAGESKKYSSIFVVDGGGRSFDIGYLEAGRIVTAGCKSLAFGGNRLLEEVRKDIVTKATTGGNPSDSAIQQAVYTGQLKRGASYFPVSDSVELAKRQLAKDVMKGFNEIFQANRNITAESVDLVLTVGGSFNETSKFGQDGYVPSLTNYVQNEFMKVSPHTLFSQIKEEYPICQGLVFYRIMLMAQQAEKAK